MAKSLRETVVEQVERQKALCVQCHTKPPLTLLCDGFLLEPDVTTEPPVVHRTPCPKNLARFRNGAIAVRAKTVLGLSPQGLQAALLYVNDHNLSLRYSDKKSCFVCGGMPIPRTSLCQNMAQSTITHAAVIAASSLRSEETEAQIVDMRRMAGLDDFQLSLETQHDLPLLTIIIDPTACHPKATHHVQEFIGARVRAGAVLLMSSTIQTSPRWAEYAEWAILRLSGVDL